MKRRVAIQHPVKNEHIDTLLISPKSILYIPIEVVTLFTYTLRIWQNYFNLQTTLAALTLLFFNNSNASLADSKPGFKTSKLCDLSSLK